MANKINMRGKFNLWPKSVGINLCLLLTLFIGNAFSQISTNDLNFNHLTIKEGLSHNTVFSLVQDNTGFIWIGTQNGLNKYDGYSFETFKSEDEKNNKGFIGKNITALFQDSKGHLWVGTKFHGINLKKNESDFFVNLNQEKVFEPIRSFDISNFFEDKAGNIWISTIGNGILKYDPITNSSVHFNSANSNLKNDLVFELIEDNNGVIWIARARQGIDAILPNGTIIQYNVDIENNINIAGYTKSLFLDDNILWIGSDSTGVYKMDISTNKFKHYISGNSDSTLNSHIVRDIYKASDGLIYIATDGGGLNILNPETGYISKNKFDLKNPYSINSNAVYCFLEDSLKNLWIGTYNGGINVLKRNQNWFELYTPLSGNAKILEQRSVLCVTEINDSTIWMGTDGGGINKFVLGNDTHKYSSLKHEPKNENSISGNVIKSIFKDSRENIWIGTYAKGLNVYNPTTQKISQIKKGPDGISGYNIWSITEQNDGSIWVGTVGGGLIKYAINNEYQVYKNNLNNPKSIASDDIMVLLYDDQERLWIGTKEKGLNVLASGKNDFLHYKYYPTNSHSLSSDEIRCIFQDSKSRIWIGTEGGGLNLYNEDLNNFKRIGKKDGLISNNIMGIVEDDFGSLWLSTFEGLSRFSYDSMVIKNFDFHSGNNNNQFNQNSILKDINGKLYFGGINGLNAIQPKNIKEEQKLLPFKIIRFEILNNVITCDELYDGRKILEKPIDKSNAIDLNYQDKSFTFYLSSFNFKNPNDETFKYKMEGFDSDWRKSNEGQHNITYTNLDPGKYTLKIQSQGKTSKIDISISPPFWKKPWFILLESILGLIIMYSILHYFIKRKEEIHNQKLLIAEKEILELKNQNLEVDINESNSKLLSTAALMAHKNEILSDVKSNLENLINEEKPSLRPIIRKLNWELKNEDYWQEFNLYVNKVDKNFIDKIFTSYPDLTQNDIRLCALLRLNLGTKEIASLLNISVRGVEKAKYRLKKRLNLSVEDDLIAFIHSL